ncbi:MAG: carbon-nitrogen family hydrolase [Deltaproteobacteria bacterium]|nr:carbon-nitrogen family hydrolase [Deltaproteobacteria bacterium]
MKVAAAQMDIAWHDRDVNHTKARDLAARANKQGADLLILPEMFSTGFSMDTSFTPESLDGPTPTLLRTLASEHDMAVIGGFVLSHENRGPVNVSLAVDGNGADLALYAKIHLIGLLGEDEAHVPGNVPVAFELGGFGAACFVCYDLRFPELFRAVADDCALIIVIASWPCARQGHWDILLRARAIENQCFVVGVNRVGEGGGQEFAGGSAVIDPLGTVVAHGGEGETLLLADIDLAQAAEVRSRLPFLKDRVVHPFEKI